MFQYLLKMILPTYYDKNSNSKNSDDKNSYDKNSNSKNSDELSIDNIDTMSSDEIWIKLFHTKLADLNRRADEAKKNITNPKKPPSKT